MGRQKNNTPTLPTGLLRLFAPFHPDGHGPLNQKVGQGLPKIFKNGIDLKPFACPRV
jgi:hypothetical protein